MRHLRLALLAVMCCLVFVSPVLAGPVLPEPVILLQPDGAPIDSMPYGDEWDSGYETSDGFTIVRDPATGVWSYALLNEAGLLIPSGLVPGRDAPPHGIAPHLRRAGVYNPNDFPIDPQGDTERPAYVGTQRILVILVRFNNWGPATTAANWANNFFGPTNSVRDYYLEVSYNQLTMAPAFETHGASNDGVVGWLNMNYNHPNTKSNTGTANRQLTRDAILAADPYVNFASYDTNGNGYISTDELHVVIIVAGYETSYGGDAASCQPGMWGHQWTIGGGVTPPTVDGKIVGSSAGNGGYTQFGEWHCRNTDNPGHMATMGIMVHEIGHDIDWPDLYDIDSSSYGIGRWSVMSYGSWTYAPGGLAGSSPVHPDAFLKWYQGWLTPFQVVGALSNVQLQQVETNQRVIQVLNNPGGVNWNFGGSSGTGEYFLLENRQQVGYDAGLVSCGIAIWHIDETRTSSNSANATDSRRLVDLEEADGLNQIDTRASQADAGDLYPGSSNKRTFDNTSNPNSRLYSGAASGVSVTNISNCASTMTADVSSTGGSAPTATATRTLTRTATRTPTRTATAPSGPTSTATRTPTVTQTRTRTATRTPGGVMYTVYLPIIVKNVPPAVDTPTPTRTATPGAANWVTILSEGFEGGFPAGWQAFDDNPNNGQHFWGKRDCRPFSGGFSGWAVGGGANGAGLGCGSQYPNGATSTMIYGPFSLADATDADLGFKLWLNSEFDFDEFCVYASTNGTQYYGMCYTGDSAGWVDLGLDLNNIPNLGAVVGQPAVWIALRFTSDADIVENEGAYLDDILLEKCVGGVCPAGPALEITGLKARPSEMKLQ